MRREDDQCRESRTRTFFKLKLLQELKVVEIFGVVFGRSLSPTCDPVWERPCGRWPGDGVPDELVSWGVRNSWYSQTTYTGTVPGLVNFMMGDGDLAKNATRRPCRNDQRFNFPLRRAVFKVQVAERFETFWPRPEQEGGEAWSSHLHGRDALKRNVGSCSQGSRRDGGRVGREIRPIHGGPAPQLPAFINLEAIHRDISRPHRQYRATHFTSSSIRRQTKRIPISPYGFPRSLSAATSTTLAPPLGFPDLSESRPPSGADVKSRIPPARRVKYTASHITDSCMLGEGPSFAP